MGSYRMTSSRGFTLIELMMVIAILAIITAIAIPAYNDQVEKTRRADATASLLNAAQQLERCFTRNNTYSGCLDESGFDSQDGFYSISVSTSATTYDLTATGQGPQAGEPCSPFALDHLGNRGAGSEGERCWGS